MTLATVETGTVCCTRLADGMVVQLGGALGPEQLPALRDVLLRPAPAHLRDVVVDAGDVDYLAPEALAVREVADAALSRASALGVEHADVRVERIRTAGLSLHDAELETSYDDEQRGLCVRVVHDGTWGFAGAAVVGTDTAARLVDEA